MSLQDDIFDVEDHCAETDLRESFDRIMKRFNEMENEVERLQDFYLTVRKYRAYMSNIDADIKKNGI